MEPVIEYSNAPNRIPLEEKLRRSAVNHFEYAERVVEMRNLAQERGDDELVGLADKKLDELRESADVIDQIADEEGIEL